MPATFLGAAVVRLSIHTSMGGQAGIITRSYSAITNAPFTTWDSTAFFAALATAGLPGAIKDALSDDARFDGLKLYSRIVPGTPPDVDQTDANAGVCSGGFGQAPAQLAALISWTSNLGGPRGRGRDYVPFAPHNAIDTTGLLLAAYKSLVEDLATILADTYVLPNSGTGGGSVSVRPCTIYTVGTPPGLAYPMTGWTVATGFATQRSRGYFGQPNSPF